MSVSGKKGLSCIVNADLRRDGSFKQGRIVSFRQSRNANSPLVLDNDATKNTAHEIRRLTELDFQGGGLEFSEDGTIKPKQE